MLTVLVLASSIWLVVSGENNVTKVERDKQNVQSTPVSVDSRFFDLGQLFSPLFSNFNQNRPVGNAGTNLPQNSQFSPAQGNFPQNPGNSWGNQGNFQPPQNQGFYPQQPNGATQWQRPPFSNVEELKPNYPDVSNNYPMQRPNQYPWNNENPSNWRPDNNFQGSNQFPNRPGSNGLNTQIQLPTNQGQDWNQPRPIPNPDQNRPTLFPDQEYQRPPVNTMNNYPIINDQYPGNESQESNFNHNQGGWQGPSNSESGTLDDISPQVNGSGNNAILGRPVIVPTTTINPNQIVFNNSRVRRSTGSVSSKADVKFLRKCKKIIRCISFCN